MRIDAEDLKRAASGNWKSIYSNLGIDVGDGRHKCCPACSPGDKDSDRFRLLTNDENGGYYCNGCGTGDGFSLVRKVLNLSFPDTLAKVADVINYTPDNSKPFKVKKDPSVALNRLWKESKPIKNGDPVSLYLARRHILEIPFDIRYCQSCYEPDSKKSYRAMIAIIRDPKGIPVTLHRTYLDKTGKMAATRSNKKLMPGKRTINGCAIRLARVENVLGIAEGIETALSCTQLFKIPTWAAISTSGMASFEPPEGIERVVIYGDMDFNMAGHKAAYALAHRLLTSSKYSGSIDIKFPEKPGTDFNDLLAREAP